MNLSQKEKYDAIARLLTSISVVAIGYGLSGPIGASILAGIGINLTSDDLKTIRDRKWRRQWLNTLSNDDIKLAIARSIENAINQLEVKYFRHKHLRRGEEISHKSFFKYIKKNLQDNIIVSLESNETRNELDFFFKQEHDDLGFKSISNQVVNRSPVFMATVIEQNIVEYLQQNFHKEVQYSFTEELKSNTRVWIVFQKVYLEKIAKGLVNIQKEINEINLKLDNRKDKRNKGIPKYLTRIPTINLKRDFIGRKNDLKKLRSYLSGTKPARLVLVNGIGGIGKTTLAIAYVQRYGNEYDHLLWIKRGEDFVNSVVFNEYLISSLGIVFINEEEIIHRFQRIMRRLNELPGRILMVIDNAQETIADNSIYNILPCTPQWDILLTSRINLNGFEKLSLDTLSFDDARNLFLRYYNGSYTNGHLKNLLIEINNHTLTVELIAKLLDKMNGIISLNDMTTALKNKKLNDLRLQEKIWTVYTGEERSIYMHLAKTFELTKLTDEELWLLKQFVVLPPLQYTITLLADLLQKDIFALNTLLNSLINKGWILIHTDKTFAMHRLIQQVMSYTLLIEFDDVDNLLENIIQKTTLDSRKSFISNNLPWLEYAYSLEQFFEKENSGLIVLLRNNIALILRDLGEYEKAFLYAKKAVVTSQQVLSPFDARLSNSYYVIALVLRSLGKYKAALIYSLEDLAICSFILNKTDIALADSYNSIAAIYLGQGNYEKAIEFSDKATYIYEYNLGSNHQDVASAYNDKSLIFRTLGEYDDALLYSQKALNIYQDLLEENHPNLATCYNNMALIYRNTGQYRLALKYNEKAIDIYKSTLEKEHPSLVKAYNNIALVYNDLGDFEKGLFYCIEAEVIAAKIYTSNHPYLANVYTNLSLLYSVNGLYTKALEYIDRAITIMESNKNLKHPTLATAYNNKAFIHRGLREYNEALECHKKANKIIKKRLDPTHPNIAASYNNIALLYCDMGEFEVALEYHKKAIKIRELISTENNPFLAVSYSNIAYVFYKLGDFEKALLFSQKAIEIQEVVLEKQHPELIFSYENIISIYMSLKQFNKADEIRKRIISNLQ